MGRTVYIAREHVVLRLSTFGGPNERFVADNTLPAWTTGPRATPAAVSYGFAHEQDSGGSKVQIWSALGWDAFGPPTESSDRHFSRHTTHRLILVIFRRPIPQA